MFEEHINQNPFMGMGSTSAFSGASGPVLPGLSAEASQLAQQSASAADPFAGQREQYQGQLAGLMGGPAQGQVNADIQNMRQVASQPLGGPYMDMLQKLMTDKSSITMTPGSQFAMEQGQGALARSKAAQGFLGSGNIMTELQKQAQGMASQDYDTQLKQLRDAAELSRGMQGQQFTQSGEVVGASGKGLGEQANRLALLSGANTGSPGTAGQILANQFDWARQGLGGAGTSAGAGGGAYAGGAATPQMGAPGSGYRVAQGYFGTRLPSYITGQIGAYEPIAPISLRK